MKCEKCGYENNNDAKFCNECGENLYENQVNNNQIIEQENKTSYKFNIFDMLMFKLYNMFTKRRSIIILMIPALIVIIILSCTFTYRKITTPEPEEVFKEFKVNKNNAFEQYESLPSKDKQQVQKLIKDDIQSAYDSKDYSKVVVEGEIWSYIPELKDYINTIQENTKYRRKCEELQKEIDKANGINKLDGVQVMTLVDEYCLIPSTYEDYDDVLDKIISLRDIYYKKFYNTPESVKKRKIQIGMSKKEVLASSWGKPKSINKTTNAYGTNEQWVYYGNNYLYFDGDKLTSIQN